MNKLIAIIMVMLPIVNLDSQIVVSEFDKNKEDMRWYTVNDGVMGGLSQGIFQFTENGTGIFKGDLSLDNNGGFSWLKGVNQNLSLKDSEGISIRIKGDGRKYAFTLKNPDRRRVMYFASFFETKKDEWQEINIPFKTFKGYFYGQNVNAVSSMNLDNMKEFGIILLDKKEGPFILEIDWVKTY